MKVKMLDRRVCGNDSATDFFIERSLKDLEIEKLKNKLRGRLSVFGSLFYIDFDAGRLTLTSNSERCTLRTKTNNPDEKIIIAQFLSDLEIVK